MFEIEWWRLKWLVEKNAPKTAIAAFEACNEDFFPNIKTILKIFCIIPVTTSFSTLRRLKSWLRSSMSEDRLNGLALLNVDKEIEINIADMINKLRVIEHWSYFFRVKINNLRVLFKCLLCFLIAYIILCTI